MKIEFDFTNNNRDFTYYIENIDNAQHVPMVEDIVKVWCKKLSTNQLYPVLLKVTSREFDFQQDVVTLYLDFRN